MLTVSIFDRWQIVNGILICIEMYLAGVSLIFVTILATGGIMQSLDEECFVWSIDSWILSPFSYIINSWCNPSNKKYTTSIHLLIECYSFILMFNKVNMHIIFWTCLFDAVPGTIPCFHRPMSRILKLPPLRSWRHSNTALSHICVALSVNLAQINPCFIFLESVIR